MDLVRIGDKVLSKARIAEVIEEMLRQRERGVSQADTARIFGVDRSFVSWLEKLGELRKGRRLALVGFPVANKERLMEIASEEGVEFVLLMTDRERWAFAEGRSGVEVINEIFKLVAHIRSYDVVILLGSDERLRVTRALVGPNTAEMSLGESPLKEDVYVDERAFRQLIRSVRK